MRTLLLTIAYDGTAYHGWQFQPSHPTIQGTIEDVLFQITQAPCRLRAAGRTDAGVHARGQIASFQSESPVRLERLHAGLNALLPADILVHQVREVPLAFNARRHNEGKRYRYTIYNAPLRPLDERERVHHVPQPLDVRGMGEAASLLVGTHDFSAFRAADCDRETTVRTLFRCTVSHEPPFVFVDVEGTAFLKNMVRIIAGTLVGVGTGRFAPSQVEEMLEGRDRRNAGSTAPPHGLCLMEVFLPPNLDAAVRGR